jgi:hypothetical protein
MVISRTVVALIIAGAMAFAGVTVSSFAQGRGQGRGTSPPSQPAKVGKSTAPKTQPSGHVKTPVVVHPPLARHVQPLLPGLDLNVASQGFRNLGQFVAAAHVSNNLGIPFTELKTRMVTQNRSLGQAIQELRPNANASAEVAKAERQARATLGRSGK